MLEAISTGVGKAITMCGFVVNAITSESGSLYALLPVIGLSIGLGLVGFGIAKIKSLVWGM